MTVIETMEERAARFLREQTPLADGDTVLCALSGGPDSVALFHILRHLAPRLGFALAAVHLNHGLRGAESDRDEAFVRGLCARCGVPLTVENAAMAALPLSPGESVETRARALRYAFFARAAAAAEAQSQKAAFVATAHTASDNAETLLFRLARGTSLAGAGGIPPVRGRYLRPLLSCTRAETLAYCAAGGHAYVTDSTNLQPVCSRNRLRLEVLPVLRALNPEAEQALAAFAADAREDAAFLDGLAAQLLRSSAAGAGWRAASLAEAAGPVRRAALAQLLAGQGGAAGATDRRRIAACEAVLQGAQPRAQLSDGFFARRSGGIFYFEQAPKTTAEKWQFAAAEGDFLLPDGRLLSLEAKEYEEFVKVCGENKKELKNSLNYGMINKIPVFRTRLPGDTFCPAGRGVTKPLGKLFAEAGVPVAARQRRLVLAEGSRVLWLEGFGPCEELFPRPGCRGVWQIKIKKAEE